MVGQVLVVWNCEHLRGLNKTWKYRSSLEYSMSAYSFPLNIVWDMVPMASPPWKSRRHIAARRSSRFPLGSWRLTSPNCWYPCAGVQWVHLSQQNKWNRNSTVLFAFGINFYGIISIIWYYFLGFSTRSGSYGFRGKKINDDQSNWGLKGWLFGHKGTPRRNDSFEDYKVSGAIQVNIWCNVICYCFILCLDAYYFRN